MSLHVNIGYDIEEWIEIFSSLSLGIDLEEMYDYDEDDEIIGTNGISDEAALVVFRIVNEDVKTYDAVNNFGGLERNLAVELLNVLSNDRAEDYLIDNGYMRRDDYVLGFNPNSVQVYLTTEDGEITMVSEDGKLIQHISTPYDGHDGSFEELANMYDDMHIEDQEYMRELAEDDDDRTDMLLKNIAINFRKFVNKINTSVSINNPMNAEGSETLEFFFANNGEDSHNKFLPKEYRGIRDTEDLYKGHKNIKNIKRSRKLKGKKNSMRNRTMKKMRGKSLRESYDYFMNISPSSDRYLNEGYMTNFDSHGSDVLNLNILNEAELSFTITYKGRPKRNPNMNLTEYKFDPGFTTVEGFDNTPLYKAISPYQNDLIKIQKSLSKNLNSLNNVEIDLGDEYSDNHDLLHAMYVDRPDLAEDIIDKVSNNELPSTIGTLFMYKPIGEFKLEFYLSINGLKNDKKYDLNDFIEPSNYEGSYYDSVKITKTSRGSNFKSYNLEIDEKWIDKLIVEYSPRVQVTQDYKNMVNAYCEELENSVEGEYIELENYLDMLG